MFFNEVSKMSSKFTDVSSSQHTSSVDMSDSKVDKKNYTAEFTDSGVISDAIFSEEITSDLSEGNEKQLNKEAIEETSDNNRIPDMNVDSGIDIDVSGQIFYTRSESLKYEKSSVADSKTEKIHESKKQQSTDKSDRIFNPYKVPLLPGKNITLETIYTQDDDGDTQLHNAIAEGHQTVAKFIVFVTPTSKLLNIQNNDAETCLHLSVLTNQPHITRLLLLAGAKTDLENRQGNTALHLACMKNNINCVRALLTPVTSEEKKYYEFKYYPEIDPPRNHINDINYDGLSCIHIAANNRNGLILGELLANGADINVREWKAGYTILHSAVESGDIDLVRFILHQRNVDLEQENYGLYTAYQLSEDYPEISKMLLDSKAKQLEFYDDYTDESDSDDDYEYSYDASSIDQISHQMGATTVA